MSVSCNGGYLSPCHPDTIPICCSWTRKSVVAMSYKSQRLTTILCLAFLLIATGGCSRVSISYNSADFLIERYARDYLGLDDPQIESWEPKLESALARHRREDLPYLARFFNDAHTGAMKGFDAQRMRCLVVQFEDLYRRNMRVAVDLAAPLLTALTPDQIRALEDKFRREKAEEEEEGEKDAAGQVRKRAKRYQESIAWWTGPLTKQQKTIVREQTAAMPDTTADWIAYRSAERKGLIDLLDRGASEAEIHNFLNAWLVEHRNLPAGLRTARKQMRDRISELFIRLDATFSAEQRTHFVDRLADLRDDFMSLQRQPRMASVRCSGAG